MADFTIIRPANDAPALELSGWCAHLLPAIRSNHTVLQDLYAGAATRAAVDAALPSAGCVAFFGHGRDAELVGASAALVDTANIGRAAGAIFVAIACSSAKVLGPDADHQGVRAYLGFRDRFVWVSRDPDRKFEPAASAGVSRLLGGDTIGDARQQMHSDLGDVVDYYLNGHGKRSPNRALGWLSAFWDQQQLELHGDLSATL